MILRDYQQRSVEAVRATFRGGKNAPLLVLPTGGGKTIIFCHIAMEAAKRGNKVIILVHRVELLRQTSEALTFSGVQHGLIHPDYSPNIMADVQVASVQTLIKRMHKFPFDPALIIIDEAHHATAGSWKKIGDYYSTARKLGVTATPCRSDGAGLGMIFDELVVGPSVQDLIDLNFLVRPVVYAPPRGIDLTGIRTVMGDYDKKEVASRVDKPKITGDAVKHYTQLCPGEPAVVFCVNIEHAKHVAAEFREAGYTSFAVDGTMEDQQRKLILGGLADGTVQVVTSCDLISEGTDIPAIACAILLRPTKSLGLFLQQVGRALRPIYASGYDLSTVQGRAAAIAAGPKPNGAVILDHVGNSGGMKDGRWVPNHGLPEQPREWSLEGIVKRKGKQANNAKIRVDFCKACLATFAPQPKCPECGAVIERPVEEVPKVVEGSLQQVSPEEAWQIKKQASWEVRQAGNSEAALREIAKARGYKMGWVRHMLKVAEEREAAKAAKQRVLSSQTIMDVIL